jgi:tetratricopeptide (TPR) repeat protein
MGELRSNRGDLEGASRLFSSALENCPGAPGLRAKALRGLGVVENRLGDHRKAQELLEESARDAMAAVDSRGMLLAHLELGKVFMGRGMYEEAISHFSKCAAGFGPVDLAKVYVDMGAACAHIGRLDEAKLHLENAVKLSSETGQPRTRAYAHASLAEVLSGSGDYESARECCFAALEVFTELGDKAGASAAYASLGAIDRLRGDIAGSEEHRRESLAALDGAEVPPVVQK